MEMENRKTFQAGRLASLVSGKLIGNADRIIKGVSGIEESQDGYLTFAENEKKMRDAEKSQASLIVVSEEFDWTNKDLLLVSNPRMAFAAISQLFQTEPYLKPGTHSSAVISNSAVLGKNISVHPHVVVDENAEIGDNVILAPGVYIGRKVEIGANTILHPGVIVEADSVIGKNVIIHAGSIIGADGYGFVTDGSRHHKIAQLGNVVIGDDVEIGANVTVDRAASGSTVIASGTKIDNLVQIAHNVQIGENCLIVAQTGVAGSSCLKENVILGGQVGIVDHINLASEVKVGSKSLITKDIPAGSFYSGIPAQNHFRELKEQAVRRRLPKLMKRIDELERKIKKIENDI